MVGSRRHKGALDSEPASTGPLRPGQPADLSLWSDKAIQNIPLLGVTALHSLAFAVDGTADSHHLFYFQAPDCFMRLPCGAEAAALACWRTLLHPEGDHWTLINVYRAYQDVALTAATEQAVELWCQEHFLQWSALRAADAIRAELTEIVRRIELPYAEPAFGSPENTRNLRKALLSGYFMQVSKPARPWRGAVCWVKQKGRTGSPRTWTDTDSSHRSHATTVRTHRRS
ncbi:putative pre-mRNA-splicing factor ATP-dependent RNA helicase DHX32 [Echinops telfairi]|uniref:Pre-mRNA-splicing factor ATP-dependent RNA helicase DHX32 n=1 Tax=Echinops telfairi TaxID=9371 RepID=A0AC55D6G2_ECHTE|nr:putative pre-mRNA-splicing factor ATP-dependent RNA helicase DHX32 [Echinops telfairi]